MEVDHESQGRRVHGCKDGDPGVWLWQFRIGDETKTGKTETKINFLAIRRVQLRIDRELKAIGQKTA